MYESNRYSDVLRCFLRSAGADCAEMVSHLITDERSLKALEVARRHADGQVTEEEELPKDLYQKRKGE